MTRPVPRRLRAARRWLVAIVAPSAALPAVAPAQRGAAPNTAWTFTWTVTPTAGGRSIPNGRVVLDVAIWKGTARLTVRDGPLRMLTGEGGTMLVRATDSSLAIVKPARREVLLAASGDLGALLGGPGAGVPLEISEVTSRTRPRGAGTPAFTFATRRVELTQTWTMQVSTPSMRRALRTEQVSDLEISRDIGRLDPGFRAFAEQFARSLGLPPAVRARLRTAERNVPDGMPVRVVTTAVTVSGTDTLRSVSRAELSALRQVAVDTTTFTVPGDYRVTEMSRLLQPRRRP